MEALFFFLVDILISGLVLLFASKVTGVNLVFKETVFASGGAAIASLLPILGWPLSVIVLFYLLKKFSSANVWPDLILMVVVGRLISFIIVALLGGL